jgi:crossover junction endodeoxyribonuclease RuvC
MRIIGVDPGNVVTGFGVIERHDRLQFVAAGTIRPKGSENRARRLSEIYNGLLENISEYSPQAMSLERSFVAMNVKTAFILGEARAAAMLAAAHRGLDLFEYTPTDVKLSVAGYGRAEKAQVKMMVRRTLGLAEDYQVADDAADALAIALCHLFREQMTRSIASADALRNRPLRQRLGIAR